MALSRDFFGSMCKGTMLPKKLDKLVMRIWFDSTIVVYDLV